MSQKKQLMLSRLQPWLFTLVHTQSLQRMKILAFGRTSESAFSHFRILPMSGDWYVDDVMMLSNDKFVCVASFSNLNILAPWL